jgi:TIR domain-containing protein
VLVDSPSVFLSHAHEDNAFALGLASALSERGIPTWVDRYELRIGDSIIERVSTAIAEGDFLLAIVSPASIRSRWCQQELAWAATRGIEDKRVVVLPIRYEKAAMPPSLVDRYWADADETDVPVLADRIAHDIARHSGADRSAPRNAWLRSAQSAFELENPATQERWLFHLEGAARTGRASVRVDGSVHHAAAERLERLGALTRSRATGSWVFYEITERGHDLLVSLRGREPATARFEVAP